MIESLSEDDDLVEVRCKNPQERVAADSSGLMKCRSHEAGVATR